MQETQRMSMPEISEKISSKKQPYVVNLENAEKFSPERKSSKI